ncbi:hypothetical protein OG897_30000 [Streptomyces sp. NBC_00237]|uniref:hypothetical protein n=1 Tax=Streptomyces sp. NBC_00237 TaxID=2975687 RepID=UPI00224FB727|nr:hypothetical protein [Streptomyces sp. NBC_00237]MCX5205674.1 hypothetical protein [Streptomyces sp. NBC_00237]
MLTAHDERREAKIAGWIGIAMVALFLVPLPFVRNPLSRPFPYWSDSSDSIGTWFAQNPSISGYTIDIAFGLLFIWFAAGLKRWLTAPGRAPLQAELLIPTALSVGICWMMSNAAFLLGPVAAERPDAISSAYLHLTYDLCVTFGYAGSLPLALFSYAAGSLILKNTTLPRWTGWTSHVLAVAHFGYFFNVLTTSDTPFTPWGWGSFGSYVGFALWALVLCTMMIRAPRPTTQPAQIPAPAAPAAAVVAAPTV